MIVADRRAIVTPWEHLRLPHEVDGSAGAFRAPLSTYILGMDNDYEDIQAWLALHKSPATQRAYRKEAERLILWAIVARGKALSSLTTKDVRFPRQTGHPFHGKLDTDSTAIWTAIPAQTGH